MLIVFLASVAVVLLLMGIRIVRPTHRGLIERLGRYQRFANPGFHWIVAGIVPLVKDKAKLTMPPSAGAR